MKPRQIGQFRRISKLERDQNSRYIGQKHGSPRPRPGLLLCSTAHGELKQSELKSTFIGGPLFQCMLSVNYKKQLLLFGIQKSLISDISNHMKQGGRGCFPQNPLTVQLVLIDGCHECSVSAAILQRQVHLAVYSQILNDSAVAPKSCQMKRCLQKINNILSERLQKSPLRFYAMNTHLPVAVWNF